MKSTLCGYSTGCKPPCSCGRVTCKNQGRLPTALPSDSFLRCSVCCPCIYRPTTGSTATQLARPYNCLSSEQTMPRKVRPITHTLPPTPASPKGQHTQVSSSTVSRGSLLSTYLTPTVLTGGTIRSRTRSISILTHDRESKFCSADVSFQDDTIVPIGQGQRRALERVSGLFLAVSSSLPLLPIM